MKRKLVASILTLCLSASMLIGCGSAAPAAAPAANAPAAEDAQEASGSGEEETDPFAEHMTISYAGILLEDGFDYTAGSPFHKYFTDKFNIEWEITPLTFDNWYERLNTWINADDISDMNC